MNDRSPLLSIQKLTYTIEDKPILQNINGEVYPNELITIIGPNGAGKSTLLRHLNRLIPIQHGNITLYQHPLNHYSAKKLAKEIAYVPQNYDGILSFTVEEFVGMGRYAHLDPLFSLRPSDLEAVHAILETTHLIAFRKRILKTLSGGERQRVFIAAALAQEAKILLLDEPTSFLDPKHQVEIYHLLKKINTNQNVVLIIVSHDLNFALQYSDRVMALKDGKIICFEPPNRFLNDHLLETIFETSFHYVNIIDSTQPFLVPVIK